MEAIENVEKVENVEKRGKNFTPLPPFPHTQLDRIALLRLTSSAHFGGSLG
jgi:hypothetical protein